jgi:UDP-N-acetylglucosamine--N-acetylmuramyl-(pentapeptide) pyrophosphoryl-undecaprenol N-acetylglucosamine transferase
VRNSFKEITKQEARKKLKLDLSERVIFATGGSLGARSINNAVTTLAEEYLSIGYRIILASGKRDYDDLIRRKRMPDGIFEIRDYITEQHLYLAAADLVICRAGAITCAEIAVLGKPSIMVPYPYAAGDHQTLNARAFEERGACVLIPDDKLEASALYGVLGRIITDREELAKMGKAALALAFPEAADDIYEQIVLLKSG